MSTFGRVHRRCAVCGEESDQSTLYSTNAFGSPDLDLRPPEMRRSTMSVWLEECPACGYVAPDLEEPCTVERAYLESEEYRGCEGLALPSELAVRCYRGYLIRRREGNDRAAMNCVLWAAWACEDRYDTVLAPRCRSLAADLAAKILDAQEEKDSTLQLQHLDMLRRARRTTEAIRAGKRLRFEEPLLEKLRQFQLRRAAWDDYGRYTVEYAAEHAGDEPYV